MNEIFEKLIDLKLVLILSVKQQLGRRFWLVPLFVLGWPMLTGTVSFLFGEQAIFDEDEVQNLIIGIPLFVMAIGMGVGIISNEIEQRTLEVTYTIPGGARRVWLLKLGSAAIVILISELLMAAITWKIYTEFPPSKIFGAFRGAMFFLVLGMGLGALLKNELLSAMIGGAILFFSIGFSFSKWSPLFDPLWTEDVGPTELLAWSIQNYVGVILVTLGLAALSFSRAERREQLLE